MLHEIEKNNFLCPLKWFYNRKSKFGLENRRKIFKITLVRMLVMFKVVCCGEWTSWAIKCHGKRIGMSTKYFLRRKSILKLPFHTLTVIFQFRFFRWTDKGSNFRTTISRLSKLFFYQSILLFRIFFSFVDTRK